MCRFLIAAMAVVALLCLNLVSESSTATADEGRAVPYCCAWGSKIGDAELTYTISGASGEAARAIETAVAAWKNAGTGLTLTQAPSGTSADIKLTLKKGGGVIAGQAMRKADRSGFVTSCTVSLSGKAFGQSALTTLEQVTKHELGHCLGLGHSNWDTDLMSPTINPTGTAVTACHIEGVRQANAWKLIANSGTPALTAAGAVACSDGTNPG